MAQRTKIEAEIKGLTAIVREVYVDSGRTKRVISKLDCRKDSIEDFQAQLVGFLKAASETEIGRTLDLVLGRIYN
mgnify:CR=1 FL=1